MICCRMSLSSIGVYAENICWQGYLLVRGRFPEAVQTDAPAHAAEWR